MLFIIALLYRVDENTAYFISQEENLSSFGWLKRGTIREFMTLAMREGAKSVKSNDPMVTFLIDNLSIKLNILPYHFETKRGGSMLNNLVSAIITDQDYNQRICARILQNIHRNYCDEFLMTGEPTADQSTKMPFLKECVGKFQEPKHFDKITKLQDDIEEVKEIMQNNVQKVLERGEKLDEMVEKSEDLSRSSQEFYKASRKLNRCCFLF